MEKDTVCRLCSSCCPITVDVVDGKLISAQRKSFLDKDKRLVCPKLKAAPDIVSSPTRLTVPLVRDSATGDFCETSWEEALRLVAQKFNYHKKHSGAESVAWLRGMAADWGAPWDYPNRLMNLFGSPNTIGNGSICFVARDMAHCYVYGSMAFPEAKNSRCIIVWGKNDVNTALGAAEAIFFAKEQGAKLIVIDPVETTLAKKADIWLRIRPGHDGLLAMAMINEIIEKELYDKDFVNAYTTGFERLKEVSANYSADKVANQIWLTPRQIREVAHLYATIKPASIIDGNGLDMHRHVFDTTRAVAFLRPLTGNLDTSGGDVLPQPIPVKDMQLRDRLPEGALPITSAFPLFNTFSPTWGNQVQGCIVDAILEEKPYPLKMVVVQSGNPVVTMADSKRTRAAFDKVDSLVVIDMFMTETARMADVVLPAASCFEKTQLNRASIRNNPIILQNEVIPPVGQSWPDWKITFALARELGFSNEFPWQTAEEAIDYQLEPTGVDVQSIRNQHNAVRLEELQYEKYLQQPFNTPTGKVEFYSERLAQAGLAAVPFEEGKIENPISFFDQADEYPLLGISGSRDIHFTNSQYRTVPTLLEKSSKGKVDIHPRDAALLGILSGDVVEITTPKGSIEMEAKLSTVVRQGSVRIAWGWGEYSKSCNLNTLTEDDARGPVTGTSTSRSFMCRIKKV
ncbi:molybdopterin-containing oxidoreductase family protein [Desulfogranum marinum]|uniref:molybdopterin-containing oxidoreductase family protein n=1 Tax=Desulfogranum marinum TaxID=453220 RepID=UPI0019669904|nr:molybdopterin-dependent oxidoreductase [Desulfogranum marinum]MBM9512148.1 molybdopterin-dependent oxidoreductase [Desulfogranum marinum]